MNLYYYSTALFLGTIFFCLHIYHVSILHENIFYFSYLSTFEREMSYRSELGFYYYFYKVMVKAESISQGWNRLTSNNHTEYPNTINAVEKYNVYPEIFVAILYRLYHYVCSLLNISNQVCFQVSRGDFLPPVISCVGSGTPEIFYTNFVWFMSGCTAVFIFLYGLFLSESLLGGIISIFCFFYNHSEATRVTHTPQLRESFAYPILLVQSMLISKVCQTQYKSFSYSKVYIDLFFLSQVCCLCLISWQLSQFVFLTQICAILVLFVAQYPFFINLTVVLISFLISLIEAYTLMFENEFVLPSMLMCVLVSCLTVIPALDYLQLKTSSIMLRSLTVIIVIAQVICLKWFVLTLTHDSHIIDMLKAKFFTFNNLHTKLYLCSKEFDFLGWDYISNIFYTFLLPSAVFTLINLVTLWSTSVSSDRWLGVIEAKIAFNILQLGSFAIMAFLFMRLKLFLTPQLCILSSLLASPKCMIRMRHYIRWGIIIGIILIMTSQGVQNIKNQHQQLDSYEDEDLESMLKWIMKHTPSNSSFAGLMQTTSSVLLVADRPIVNHPHYEYTEMRERTEMVYTGYSRKPLDEVYKRLKEHNVHYFISSTSCFNTMQPGCFYPDVWDAVDIINRNRRPTCDLMQEDNQYFIPVHKNAKFIIYKLKS